MQTSILLARLIGLTMLIAGIAVLVNRDNLRALAEDFLASRALLFFSGMALLPAGIAIVLTHNVWAADWRVLITVLGWLAAIGAAVRLIAPQFVVQTARKSLTVPNMPLIAGGIWVVLGLILCFFGFR